MPARVGATINVSGCVPDLAIDAYAVVCFSVLPGETSVAIRIRDAISNPIRAFYGFADAAGAPLTGGIAAFCGSAVLAIPPGAAFVELDLASGGSSCLGFPPGTETRPTTGTVIGSFS